MSADTDPRNWHTCPACGKRAWPSRRAARRAARGPLTDLNAYPCPHRPGWWHLGHLPRSRKVHWIEPEWREVPNA